MPKPVKFPTAESTQERYTAEMRSMFGHADSSYIPGYSEIVQANDIEASDDFEFSRAHRHDKITKESMYEVIGARPQELPAVFRWLRIAAPNGDNSYRADVDLMQFTRRGYRLATREDLESHGYGWPPAAIEDSAGRIRRLDLALFVVEGARERAYDALLTEHTAKTENKKTVSGNATEVPIESEALEKGKEPFTLTTKD